MNYQCNKESGRCRSVHESALEAATFTREVMKRRFSREMDSSGLVVFLTRSYITTDVTRAGCPYYVLTSLLRVASHFCISLTYFAKAKRHAGATSL